MEERRWLTQSTSIDGLDCPDHGHGQHHVCSTSRAVKLGQHHRARRRHRFHPLRHPDPLAIAALPNDPCANSASPPT
jgi:hypothetical protein